MDDILTDPSLHVMVNKPKKPKVLVIGDSCTDEFIYGKCDRLAPEGPIPVFEPINRTVNFGMAANVRENIVSLSDFKVSIVTNKTEILKTRFVDEHTNHTIIRVDRGDKVPRIDGEQLDAYLSLIKDYDAVIVSDYNKGFLDIEDILSIGSAARRDGVLSFIDTKKPLYAVLVDDYSFVKINKNEWLNAISVSNNPTYVVTDGKRGAFCDGIVYPVEEVDIRDLSGAGDTFLAALVVEILRSKDLGRAITFANEMSTKVVQKRGVSNASL